MTNGHRKAQALFEELGRGLNYVPAASFSKKWPTDGVWWGRGVDCARDRLPVAALEVVVSEASKAMKGSVLTLEKVSPALGILLVHEEEIRRRMLRGGMQPHAADARVDAIRADASALAADSRQRIEVWSYHRLVRRHREIAGASSMRRVA